MKVYPLAYTETCNPNDGRATQENMNTHYFFSDVDVRWYYPSYMKKYFERNINIVMEEEDEKALKE